MTVRPSRISLRIERLVVDGLALSAHEGLRLRGALEGELARLLRDAPPVPRGAFATLPSREVQLRGPVAAQDLGRQVARAVHASLTRTTGAR